MSTNSSEEQQDAKEAKDASAKALSLMLNPYSHCPFLLMNPLSNDAEVQRTLLRKSLKKFHYSEAECLFEYCKKFKSDYDKKSSSSSSSSSKSVKQADSLKVKTKSDKPDKADKAKTVTKSSMSKKRTTAGPSSPTSSQQPPKKHKPTPA